MTGEDLYNKFVEAYSNVYNAFMSFRDSNKENDPTKQYVQTPTDKTIKQAVDTCERFLNAMISISQGQFRIDPVTPIEMNTTIAPVPVFVKLLNRIKKMQSYYLYDIDSLPEYNEFIQSMGFVQPTTNDVGRRPQFKAYWDSMLSNVCSALEGIFLFKQKNPNRANRIINKLITKAEEIKMNYTPDTGLVKELEKLATDKTLDPNKQSIIKRAISRLTGNPEDSDFV